MIRVAFLWHMHQPFYKDLISGQYRMPWVRMHALKDYFGMVEILRDFPAVRMTFNLVPSLMTQIEDYARGTADEPLLRLVFKPPAELIPDERIYLLGQLFQANPERVIARYPRYRQLFDMYRSAGFQADRALVSFSTRDFADLQVLSQLAWFDEIYQDQDPDIRALIVKKQNYSVEDQQLVARKERELIGRIEGAYREAQDRGQVELSTSPFYHPILPLVCDTDVGGESHPGASLPRRFRHPEDARLQLERAIALHTRMFGRVPEGLWPSEGSVSDEALAIAADLGFRWAATGEGVLARSIGHGFPRDAAGLPHNPAGLYGGYELETGGGRIRLFFRDHYISDLIGFVYSNMDPRQAAWDLLDRLRRCGRAALNQVPDPVISVILDGENAWEYYSRSGRDFFEALYDALGHDRELRTVTMREAAELPARGRLTHVVPGSWINANFDVWIGHEQDNRSWNLLLEARDFYSKVQRQPGDGIPPGKLELALEELLIAEGSDWNWWYGPEHHTANDREFDELYRAHLANVYAALGARAPDSLAVPIAVTEVQAFSTVPTNYIRPRIDGRVSSYFEWMGAGIYSLDQRSSAMHGKQFYLREMQYGLNQHEFYLRLDFTPEGQVALDRLEIRVTVGVSEQQSRVSMRVGPARESLGREVMLEMHGPELDATAGAVECAFDRILELKASLCALGIAGFDRFRFQVVLWEGGLPIDLLPPQGWLEILTAEPIPEY